VYNINVGVGCPWTCIVGCRQHAKLHIFDTSLVFLSKIRDHRILRSGIRISFIVQVAKKPINNDLYRSMYYFHILLHCDCVITIHQHNRLVGQTNRRIACSISAIVYIHVGLALYTGWVKQVGYPNNILAYAETSEPHFAQYNWQSISTRVRNFGILR